MDISIETSLNAVWSKICEPRRLNTPDESAKKYFSVVSSNQHSVEIATEGGSPLRIQREAFLVALRYLTANQHNQDNPCEIRSNLLAKEAGPLCLATRAVNNGTMVITYIVPMLATTGLVDFRSSRPNAVWLV